VLNPTVSNCGLFVSMFVLITRLEQEGRVSGSFISSLLEVIVVKFGMDYLCCICVPLPPSVLSTTKLSFVASIFSFYRRWKNDVKFESNRHTLSFTVLLLHKLPQISIIRVLHPSGIQNIFKKYKKTINEGCDTILMIMNMRTSFYCVKCCIGPVKV
jgi:hypothetical protein